MLKLIACVTPKIKFNVHADAIPISTAPLSEQDQIQKQIIQSCEKVSRKKLPFIPFSPFVIHSKMGEIENLEVDPVVHQHEVIPNLFIGDFAAFKAVTKKNHLHIGLAIRVNQEPFQFQAPSDVSIMEIGFNIPDNNSEASWVHLSSQFKDIFPAVDSALAQNKRVLITCGMGISRSATTVIAYLMYRFHVTYKQAFSFLHLKRDVKPGDNFVAGLKAYEKRLFMNSLLY